eukprot:jgi/Ulvmu1/2623/UM014_0074.1
MLQRLAAGINWHRHLQTAIRNVHEAAIYPDKHVKKGLDAVAETAQEEALESVLASRHAMVPTLLAADQHHQQHKYKVAIFSKSGNVAVAQKSGQELNVAVRDMPMFTRPRQSGYHARISIRDNKILVRTELVRAIIQRTSLVLFECRRASLSEKVGLAIVHAVRSAKVKPDGIPFELRTLEVLLEQTVRYLEDKSNKIKMLSNAVQDDISRHVNMADIRRLLPLQKAVTALEYDIKETALAVAEVAESEKLVALLCLSEDQNLTPAAEPGPRWTRHMQLAHRLLLAYTSRIRGLDSHVRELTEHLDSTREIWHMQLDAMRNRIIHLGLHLEFAGLSTMIATLPAALFGMNLASGLEDRAGMFWPVAGASVACGLAAYSMLVLVHSVWPRLSSQRCRTDMVALQELLMYNVDDLGDVISALQRVRRRHGAVTKEQFIQVVGQVLGGSGNVQALSKDKLNLLYRVLDTNHDGKIDMAELVKVQHAIVASQDSQGDMESALQRQPAAEQREL